MEKSSFHPPAAAMRKPKRNTASSSFEAEEAQEDAELSASKAKIAEQKSKTTDPIARLLGATYYISDYAWPYLRWGVGALTVSQFYPQINVAIDKFDHVGDHEKRIIEHKHATLKAHGIKYAWLDWTKSLADILPQLEG